VSEKFDIELKWKPFKIDVYAFEREVRAAYEHYLFSCTTPEALTLSFKEGLSAATVASIQNLFKDFKVDPGQPVKPYSPPPVIQPKAEAGAEEAGSGDQPA
jgi:hypothetical protein